MCILRSLCLVPLPNKGTLERLFVCQKFPLDNYETLRKFHENVPLVQKLLGGRGKVALSK